MGDLARAPDTYIPASAISNSTTALSQPCDIFDRTTTFPESECSSNALKPPLKKRNEKHSKMLTQRYRPMKSGPTESEDMRPA